MEYTNRDRKLVAYKNQLNLSPLSNRFLELQHADALRGPLTNIIGLIELLELLDDEGSDRELIDKLRISAVDLDNTTRSIITTRCVEHG